MYHEEKIIDGKLHWRSTPDGEWVCYTQEQITHKLMSVKKNKCYEEALALIDEYERSMPKVYGIHALEIFIRRRRDEQR